MSEIGALATWSALVLGAWTFIAALAASADRPQLQRSAARALVMSGLFAAMSVVVLGMLLWRGDVSISYVARTIAHNLPVPYRLAALLSAPAGAVLATAALVAGFGFVATHRRRTPLGISTIGATIVALLAASVADSPFAVLPWLPADGLGMSPAMQHPAAVFARVALSFGTGCLAAAAATAADTLDSPSGSRSDPPVLPWLRAALAALAVSALLAGEAMVVSGDGSTLAPFAAWRGVLVPSIVAIVLALGASRGTAPPQRLMVATLSALGLTTVALLGTGGGSLGTTVRGAFAVTCLLLAGWSAFPRPSEWGRDASRGVVALIGVVLLVVAGGWAIATGALSQVTGTGMNPGVAWSLVLGTAFAAAGVHRDTESIRSRPGLETWLSGGVLFSLGLATLGGALSVSSTIRLASGATSTIRAPLGGESTIAHQGVSRFEASNSHVVALAAEVTRAGSSRLLSPERREYVDSRDAPLGQVVSRAGVGRGLVADTRLAILDVAADDTVTLRVQVVPLALAWRLAALLLAIGAVAPLVAHSQRRAPSPLGEPIAS